MQYYCYVFYDEDWQATYVGKGQGGRVYKPQDHPEIPPKEQIQLFHFDQEWAAYECEIELIAFWGRQCDGGTLFNKSVGGPGNPGMKYPNKTLSKKTKDKIASSMKGKHAGKDNPFYGKKHSSDAREKIRQSQIGKKQSPETCNKKSVAMKAYFARKKQEAS